MAELPRFQLEIFSSILKTFSTIELMVLRIVSYFSAQMSMPLPIDSMKSSNRQRLAIFSFLLFHNSSRWCYAYRKFLYCFIVLRLRLQFFSKVPPDTPGKLFPLRRGLRAPVVSTEGSVNDKQLSCCEPSRVTNTEAASHKYNYYSFVE